MPVSGVQGPQCASGDCLKDATPPPVPQLRQSLAFERTSDRARVRGPGTNGQRGGGADPAYIELGNVEAGTKFQLVNISKKPDATFEHDAIELEPTGRDLPSRTASIYLTQADLDRLDLKAGDLYLLRAKDAAGNVSAHLRAELEPDDWAGSTIDDLVGGSWRAFRGAQIGMLDGEAARKNLIVRAVNDQRPPVVQEDKLSIQTRTFTAEELAHVQALLAARAEIKAVTGGDAFGKDQLDALVKDDKLPQPARDALQAAMDGTFFGKLDDARFMDKKDGSVGFVDLEAIVGAGGVRMALKGDFAMEIGARMTIQNQRTGKSYEGAVMDDSTFAVPLDDMQPGDPLIFKPVDHEGHQGAELRRTYAPSCDSGMAPIVSPLGARLNGVI